MAWNAAKPTASGFLISAEHRANWTAIETALSGKNLCLDPLFRIWAGETGGDGAAAQTAAPTHYTLSGTGATVRRCGTGLGDTTTYGWGGYSCLLTYGSQTAYLEQTMLTTISSSVNAAWRTRKISCVAWLKSSTASAARLRVNDGVDSTYSAYHTNSGSWETPSTIVVTHTLNAAATTLKAGLELSSGTAYIEGMVWILGEIPPTVLIPNDVVHGMLYFPVVSNAVAGTRKGTWIPARPGIVKHTQINAATVPTGAALIVDVNTWDGSAFTSMYSTKPQLAISGGHGGAAPDTTYARRCYSATHGTATQAGGLVTYDIDQIGSTIAGADLAIEVKCMQFVDPLEAWRSN